MKWIKPVIPNPCNGNIRVTKEFLHHPVVRYTDDYKFEVHKWLEWEYSLEFFHEPTYRPGSWTFSRFITKEEYEKAYDELKKNKALVFRIKQDEEVMPNIARLIE